MSYISAVMQYARGRRFDGPPIEFVTPALSAIIAASSIADGRAQWEGIRFAPDAESYATTNGLINVLNGGLPPSEQSGQRGRTYSQLARLSPGSVDSANKTIGDLIFAQLGTTAVARNLAGIVGELHDNVESHADGAGYSAAQVYSRRAGKELQFCVADAGKGMLANVRKMFPDVNADKDAIVWCLKRGNTTAGNRSEWAQRLPDDCLSSPFGDSVDTYQNENHHVGEGLARLQDIILGLGGSLWVWTGGCNASIQNEVVTPLPLENLAWRGVVVAFDVRIPDEANDGVGQDRSQLARRIGLE